MKAVTYRQYGSADVLQCEQLDAPTPKPNEIQIRVYATEVTKADCELRSFQFPVSWFKWPLRLALGLRKPRNPVLGNYFSGEVISVGEQVTRFKEGDEIFGSSRLKMSAYAEVLCIPENYTLTQKPSNMHHSEAATLLLGGFNALHFLNHAQIDTGTRVLINGAGGSIGLFALQIAKARGAEVTAVDAPHKHAMLKEYGADECVDYTKHSLNSLRFNHDVQPFDIVFNVVAGIDFDDCEHLLTDHGLYLIANPRISDMLNGWGLSKRTNKRACFSFAQESQAEIEALRDFANQHVIRPILDRVYTFDYAADAHRRVESEQRLGAVVLTSSAPSRA